MTVLKPAILPLVPADALRTLASQLRSEDTVVSPHVQEPSAPAALGKLVSLGSAAAQDPAAYALVVESVREGYLLHYGEPRVIVGADPDLRLLAGDYLYALGLERLAGLGDLPAVRELSDLISLSAQLNADADGNGPSASQRGALAREHDGDRDRRSGRPRGGQVRAACGQSGR